MILVFSKAWRLERKIEDLGELESEWLANLDDLERVVKEGTTYNNRYLVKADELPSKLYGIIKDSEDQIINDIGSKLDENDERIVQLERERETAIQDKIKATTTLEQVRKSLAQKMSVLNQVEKDLSESKTHVEILSKKELQYETEISRLKDTVSTLSEESKELKDKTIRYKKELDESIQILGAINDILSTGNNTTNNTKSKVEEKEDRYVEDFYVKSPQPKVEDINNNKGGSVQGSSNISKVKKDNKTKFNEDKFRANSTYKGVDWIGKIASPDFPVKKEITDTSKKQWHTAEVVNILSNSKNKVTESDLDYIVSNTFKELGYTKDKANSRVFSPSEVILIVFAANTNIPKKSTGLTKLEEAVKLLYNSWLENKDEINEYIGRR